MSKVIQLRNVPDDVHDALVASAKARGISLTKYLLLELDHVAARAQAVEANAAVIRQTQVRVSGGAGREAILATLHEGRGQ